MRHLILCCVLLISFRSFSQSALDNLENSLQGVVTVAVFKSEEFSKQLGSRGATSASEEAYQKMLDLSGSQSSGSGFVIARNGKQYIVTNAHVVENASDEAGSLYVFAISRKKYEVKVVGGDTFYDIAVLEFVDKPTEEIKPLIFRTSDIRLGERVYAIGNPLGEYPYSVSDGIISAKNRTRNGQFTGRSGFLQTTATIIWGNSGGPLVDEQGQVVGINSQIAFAQYDQDSSPIWASQINFALDGRLSNRLAEEIIDNVGRVTRSYFGLEISQELGYNDEGQYAYGAPVIQGVIPGSPAYSQFKDKVGSTLESINNESCNGVENALDILEKIKPGQKASFSISKNGKRETITVTGVTLQAPQLEGIARYTLSKNPTLKLESENSFVSLSYIPTKVFEFGSERKFRRPVQGKNEAIFTVLAAGIVSEEDQVMFKVNDLKDVGAIIKLSALSGVIDFYATPKGVEGAEVKLYRHYLSGDESIQLKTLFY